MPTEIRNSLNNNIYVVRASHMTPFFDTLKQLNTPIKPLLAQVGLTVEQFNDADNLISEPKLWHFVEVAAQSVQLQHFGFLVTENTCLDSYGAFGENLCHAKNLYQALTRFISDLETHANYPNYWLEEKDNFTWLCRKGTPNIEVGKWQVEQHVVSLLIELTKIYAGVSWYPKMVKLQTANTTGIEYSKSLNKSCISKSQTFTAIAIESNLLKKQSRLKVSQVMPLSKKVPHDFTLTIAELISQGYFGEKVSAEIIADKLSINLRTLQRRLSSKNINLRQLINDYKFTQAQQLLMDVEISSVELSKRLGFTNVTNFMRFFKRMSGMTVGEYKKLFR